MVRLSPLVATVGMVAFGTFASLLAKLIYSVHAVNLAGENVPFTKPWFQVLGMFAGMSVCIVMDLPRPKRRGIAPADLPASSSTSAALSTHPANGTAAENEPLLSQADMPVYSHESMQLTESPPASKTPLWIINFPTLFDLFATACGTTGLLYTTVSVYQMLRGAQLIFSAIMSVVFLRRRLSALNYIGIVVCVFGITLVGLANVWGEQEQASRDDTVFGILLILAGQVLQAAQVVIEEFMLQDLDISSVRIVAYEGMFGSLHCLLWVFPIVYLLPGSDGGHLENPFDAFYMFSHSWMVAAVILTDMVIMLFYNVCGMEVTNSLSAVSRVIIETLRTLLVWICDLFLFYVVSRGRLGEPWTEYSYLQAVGFAFTCAATIIYNYEHLAADYTRRRKTAQADAPEDTPSTALASPAASPAKLTPSKEAVADATVEDGLLRVKTNPLSVAGSGGFADDDGDDDEEEEEEQVGSFYGSAVGSASHGSYLLVGTPTGDGRPGSLRHRSPHAH